MNELKDGYYWVKDCGSLKIAKFTTGRGWTFCGSDLVHAWFHSEHDVYIPALPSPEWISYDAARPSVVTIDGIEFTREIFSAFAHAKLGTILQIVGRKGEGDSLPDWKSLTVRRFYDKESLCLAFDQNFPPSEIPDLMEPWPFGHPRYQMRYYGEVEREGDQWFGRVNGERIPLVVINAGAPVTIGGGAP